MRVTLLDLRKQTRSHSIETDAQVEEARPVPSASQPDENYFNRKSSTPSEMMLPPDGKRYRCSWIENGLTVHADGNATCGLDDPYSRRSFGNVNRQTVTDIWSNPEYERMQALMWDGWRCAECGLAQAVEVVEGEAMPARSPLPTTLVSEATIRCNLRCPQIACIPNNDRAVRTRDADFLGLDVFKRTVDEIADGLRHVFFFNYGEPFVHAGADDMLTHLGKAAPRARAVTSTNGIPLSNLERARKVVASGALDRMLFTISGVTQESYARYHVGGRLELAMQGMANIIQAKRELGVSKPAVAWRYLTFNWNDSDEETREALRLAEAMGVDEFRFHLTHVPLDSLSSRFSPGSPNFTRHRASIDNAFGYTRLSQQPDADGFSRLEHSALGLIRWTGWQARRKLRVKRGRATIDVSTFRPSAPGRTDHVFILTPFQRLKAPLRPGAWNRVDLKVPAGYAEDGLEVELVTFDHWFPAEELETDDPRCLGVVVREDAGAAPRNGWRRGAYAPTDAAEEARLAGFRFTSVEPLTDW